MTKFTMGLLLGLLLGIGGTSVFLITAQGGDYLVMTSPRVRELETQLKQADQERDWLRRQVQNSLEVVTKLETKFLGLAQRFEDLGRATARTTQLPPATFRSPGSRTDGNSPPSATAASKTSASGVSPTTTTEGSPATPERKGLAGTPVPATATAKVTSAAAPAKESSAAAVARAAKKVLPSSTQTPPSAP